MKMIKNVLFEVLPIARFYIFPTCLAIGGCHAKKTVALLRQTSHRVIFVHFEYTQSTVIYQEHAHRKLRQAFDAILQQFSSNGNRKSMLSANRSFQAQNSTCATLLQTMLLYETCIVPSRECLWDVNKDFWHQWRSLVIITLSARAIYRQIPVSYLQTWYIRRCDSFCSLRQSIEVITWEMLV